MRIVIDIVIVLLLAYCTWSGYKRGIINGLAGILALIIGLFGACILSSSYSGEAITALKPFVSGYIESAASEEAIDKLGISDSGLSLSDAIAADPKLAEKYCEACFEAIGFHERRSDDLARDAVKLMEEQNIQATEAVEIVACETITYVGGVVLAFALIIVLLSVIANITNLSFRLPNKPDVDEIGGAIAGFVKGFLYCVFICWLLSFAGLLIGKTTLSDTLLGKFFLMFEFITRVII